MSNTSYEKNNPIFAIGMPFQKTPRVLGTLHPMFGILFSINLPNKTGEFFTPQIN